MGTQYLCGHLINVLSSPAVSFGCPTLPALPPTPAIQFFVPRPSRLSETVF